VRLSDLERVLVLKACRYVVAVCEIRSSLSIKVNIS